jgi:hypothetical protein
LEALLTRWELKQLSSGTTDVIFPGLSRDNVLEEFREGLGVFVRKKSGWGDKRKRHVRYRVDGAGRALGIVVGSARVD